VPFLTAAVVLVGVLCAVDLILTVGVIKRLREHTARLSAMRGIPSVQAGERIGEFAALTVDGEQVTADHLADDTLVGFFSPTCEPCKEKLPKFVEYARTVPGRRDRVLATVVGDGEQAEEFVAQLRPVARVVVEDSGGAVSAAFKARAYPLVLRVGPDGAGHPVVTADHVNLEPTLEAA
jgi:protein-disulfide isomerase